MTCFCVACGPDMLHSRLPCGIQAAWQGSVGWTQGLPPPLVSFDPHTCCRCCGALSRCASRGPGAPSNQGAKPPSTRPAWLYRNVSHTNVGCPVAGIPCRQVADRVRYSTVIIDIITLLERVHTDRNRAHMQLTDAWRKLNLGCQANPTGHPSLRPSRLHSARSGRLPGPSSSP